MNTYTYICLPILLVGGSLGSNSMDAFERMKSKVEALESQAEVSGELAATSSGRYILSIYFI